MPSSGAARQRSFEDSAAPESRSPELDVPNAPASCSRSRGGLDRKRFDVVDGGTERGLETARVSMRLREQIPPLSGREERVGERVRVRVRRKLAALLHAQQASTQQGLPALEAGREIRLD